ncbi:phage tail protein [Spirosoma oryzicola]|uniref:phage tail protein n=1 Tax=Spirosoma oryzicola TaxID=2898794 RepID=UPI001E5ADF88|nr:tail fiber protein [Spirosoma oryzicola]UHG93779.1 tail fiber protein [Spirosoma oryzicola]
MEPYIGEIRIFPGNFAPVGWLYCNGQSVNISDYQALFQLIGTTYGGDGQTKFALPNLQGRAVVGQGAGQGLSTYVLGQQAGQEAVTVTANQMPVHQHAVQVSTQAHVGAPAQVSPNGAYFGDQGEAAYQSTAGSATLATDAVIGQTSSSGGGQPHTNLQPYLVINYIIATDGIYPTQQ